MVSAEGPDWSALAAGVCAAVGAAAGGVAGAAAAGALAAGAGVPAAGAGVELEDCCAEHGSAADRTAQIKNAEVESFTMLSPYSIEKSRRARIPRAIPEPKFLSLYACAFVTRNAAARPARIPRKLSFRGTLD